MASKQTKKPAGKAVSKVSSASPSTSNSSSSATNREVQKLIPGVKSMIEHMMEPRGNGWITPTVTQARVFPWCNGEAIDINTDPDIPMLIRLQPDVEHVLQSTYYNTSATATSTRLGLNTILQDGLNVAHEGVFVVPKNTYVSVPLDLKIIPGMTSTIYGNDPMGVLPVKEVHPSIDASYTGDGRYYEDLCLMTPANVIKGLVGTDVLVIQLSGLTGKVYGDPDFEIGLAMVTTSGATPVYQFALSSSTPYAAKFSLSASTLVALDTGDPFVSFTIYLKFGSPTWISNLMLNLTIDGAYDALPCVPTKHINVLKSLALICPEYLPLKGQAAKIKFSQLSGLITNTTEIVDKGGNLIVSNCPPGLFPPYYGYDDARSAVTKLQDNTNTKLELRKGAHVYYLPQTLDEIEFENVLPPGESYRTGKERANLAFFISSAKAQSLKLTINWNVEHITRSSVNKGIVVGPEMLRLRQMILAFAAKTLFETIHDDNPTHLAKIRQRAMKLVKHPMVKAAMKDIAKAGLSAALSALVV